MPYYFGDPVDRLKIDDFSMGVLLVVVFILGLVFGAAWALSA